MFNGSVVKAVVVPAGTSETAVWPPSSAATAAAAPLAPRAAGRAASAIASSPLVAGAAKQWLVATQVQPGRPDDLRTGGKY
jgi:hypothetical protein